jgi:hypothetical protein
MAEAPLRTWVHKTQICPFCSRASREHKKARTFHVRAGSGAGAFAAPMCRVVLSRPRKTISV